MVSWPPTNYLPTIYRPPTDHLPTTYPPLTDHLPTTYQPPTDHLRTTYPPPTHHSPTTYWPLTDNLPTTYRPVLPTTYRPPVPTTHQPHTDHILTTYRPHTDHLPTTYRPLTDHLPTIYRPSTDHCYRREVTTVITGRRHFHEGVRITALTCDVNLNLFTVHNLHEFSPLAMIPGTKKYTQSLFTVFIKIVVQPLTASRQSLYKKQMNPITTKSMSKIATSPRAVGSSKKKLSKCFTLFSLISSSCHFAWFVIIARKLEGIKFTQKHWNCEHTHPKNR